MSESLHVPRRQLAFEDWRALLGPRHVMTDAAELSRAETATFHTTQRVDGVLRPGSVARPLYPTRQALELERRG